MLAARAAVPGSGSRRGHFAIVPGRTNTDEARVTKPIISSDSHVVEPPDCYVGRIDPKFRDQGFKGVMLPGLPGAEDYDDPMYGELFDAVVDLGLVASFHILTSSEGLRQGFRGSRINGFMSIVRGNQDLMSMFVFDGIFMRHPELRIVCVEADGGWVPHFMYRMDHAYKRHRHWLRGRELERMPSEYFREHVYFTFQDDHTAFQLKDHMNIERMMWANDYPHSDSTWPWSQDVLREQAAGLTEAEKDLVLHENVARLYGLDTSGLRATA